MFHIYYNPPRSILDLPPEVMAKIVNKLPYSDVQSVRLTCLAFNNAANAAIYGRKTALHKMRRVADSALKKCRRGLNNFSKTRAQKLRALKGVASVKCLAKIIRVADASTFYFVLDGSLPPVPRALLTDLEEALSIATDRNPLVGRDRLERIFTSVNEYLTTSMNSLHSPLKMTTVFRSVVDLSVCLPRKSYKISYQGGFDWDCDISLNIHTVMPIRDEGFSAAPLLIRLLANMNVKGIEEFMGNSFVEGIQTVDTRIFAIAPVVHCSPGQNVGAVCSLEQFGWLEPTQFQVYLYGEAGDVPTMWLYDFGSSEEDRHPDPVPPEDGELIYRFDPYLTT